MGLILTGSKQFTSTVSNISNTQARVQPKDIAQELLGTITWETDTKGFCQCPGEHTHSTDSGPRDCVVYLDGVPTIFCQHQSCIEQVRHANRALREAIEGGGLDGGDALLTDREKKQRLRAAQRTNQIEQRARTALPKILADHRWTYNDIVKDTKTPIDENPAIHWRHIVELFREDDRIWIGYTHDSGRAEHTRNFRPARSWLAGNGIMGPLTCPSTFRDGSFSRSNENVLDRRFLVVESDVLTKDQVGAVFKWLRDEVGMTLRAIVDTGGKSLHGWFDYPKAAILEELKLILPQLGCDPGMFRQSQPCRMPGVLRGENYQKLIYFDRCGKSQASKRPVQALPLPNLYYDGNGQTYWRQNAHGSWQKINETSLKTELLALGYSPLPRDGESLTEVDEAKRDIQLNQHIEFAGPLAGYSSGYYTVQGLPILVTTSPTIIKPVPGEWPTLRAIFDGLFLDGEIDQRPYVFAWLKHGYQSLASGKPTPGQALCLTGPRESGKSLLQTIITEILGGRSAKPYEFLTGDTGFNADHFAGEHLMIEDDVPSTDIRARRRLGAGIKQVTVNNTQRCHAKNKTPLILTPFWRLSISVNDETENLLILPPLDDGNGDKIIILKVKNFPMPMPTDTPERRQRFMDTIKAELPALLHYLQEWEIPANIKGGRFGFTGFHHPDIVEALSRVSPEERLLAIVDQVIFESALNSREDRPCSPTMRYPQMSTWKGTADKLESEITGRDSEFSREAQKILTFSNACGTYLGRLAKFHPDRIKSTKSKNKITWHIKPPAMDSEPPSLNS